MDKPVVFIASANEHVVLVKALKTILDGVATVKPWNTSFPPSKTYIATLEDLAATADFAVMVLGAVDETKARDEVSNSPRDNVVFESGLFAGKIGIERTFLLHDDRPLKLPSDLDGLSTLTFPADPALPANERVSAAGEKIRERIVDLGLLRWETLRGRICGTWWQYTYDDDAENAAVSLLTIKLGLADELTLTGNAWNSAGKPRADFHAEVVGLDPNGTLSYDWGGTHMVLGAVPKFKGSGQIRFGDARGATATGEFESYTADGTYLRTIRTEYRRATHEEVEKVRSAERDSVIARQLRERQNILF